MAKSAQGLPVTPGVGQNLSIFSLANARVRETVIVADSDAAGESLHLELPAHNSSDRGSAVKIGGKASAQPPAVVDAQDRADAWYSLNGQLGVIVTHESAVVYDAGRQPVNSIGGNNLAINNTQASIIPGAGTTMLLALYVSSVTFTTAGSLGVVGGSQQFWFARVTAANQSFHVPPGSMPQYRTLGGAALSLKFTGNAVFDWTAVYYQFS